MRLVFSAVLFLALVPIRPLAQTIPITEKLTQLQGQWTLDATRGTGGICGVPVAESLTIAVSEKEIRIQTSQWTGAIPMNGAEMTLTDGRTAKAGVDAGWLAITMKRNRGGAATNVMQEVYIVKGAELTVWR